MANSIIEVKNLRYKYPNSEDFVLKKLSFTIEKGECIAILGPTGAGKTTLAMALRGLIPHNFGGVYGGEVIINGKNTLEVEPGELADQIGLVFQNAETQTVGLIVVEDLAFGLENMNIQAAEMEQRIDTVSKLVDIEDLLERETHALSGGQKQRLAIGGVLAMEPDIIILDEPTAEVDPVGKEEIVKILSRLKSQKKTIILIEHEVEAIINLADRIMIMDKGEIRSFLELKESFRNLKLLNEVNERIPFTVDLIDHLYGIGLVDNSEISYREADVIDLLNQKLAAKVM